MSSKNISKNFTKAHGQRLRQIRVELAITPEEAAQKARVSSQQWRKYERGEAEPKISKMLFLLQKGFSLEWLLTGKGPKNLDACREAKEGLLTGYIAEWVGEQSRKDPNFSANFQTDCALAFPEFAKWLKERKGGIRPK